ncbi:CD225/dispanin family protein [Corynebacterium sputi]|uniref:CD225/dispanin family protein n=1 Tax=Corynebacterium sputi TaxID=489915 RepID=UPI003B835DB9
MAPVAVVALAFSYLVDSRWKRGDGVGAGRASKSVFVSSALSIAFSVVMYFQ